MILEWAPIYTYNISYNPYNIIEPCMYIYIYTQGTQTYIRLRGESDFANRSDSIARSDAFLFYGWWFYIFWYILKREKCMKTVWKVREKTVNTIKKTRVSASDPTALKNQKICADIVRIPFAWSVWVRVRDVISRIQRNKGKETFWNPSRLVLLLLCTRFDQRFRFCSLDLFRKYE